ncbi:SpoIIE family protein phosphatase [Flammeovirga pacifica]|uniref:PPM-type phosphatase domain-containing protein n=1 Tax=Flammeovirga pacifica TaxID=915059 RepID=A0A1S1YSL1_FLAPC|nr:SpoIIE family protein phosphatase [Flammeovirga pacifica]OHX64010.1 hypothetical protein NH26_20585 [Flammeovirga pacifica]
MDTKKHVIEIAGCTQPLVGELVNGDAIYIEEKEDYVFFAVVDGIGHGKIAHKIATKLISYIKERVQKDIVHLISEAHFYMQGTEGAALGIGIIEQNYIKFSTIGNINARIINDDNISLLSTDGLLGVRRRTPQLDVREIKKGDLILIHSDGINGSQSFHERINYHLFSSEILSRKLMKSWGSQYDDASIICIKVK